VRKNSKNRRTKEDLQALEEKKKLQAPLDLDTINRLNDFVIKRMVGTKGQEFALEGLVDAVQEAKDQPLLGALLILNDLTLDASNINEKMGILDVKAKTVKGDAMVNTEIQLRNTDDMLRRSAFYTSEVFTGLDSIEAGESYEKLPRIVTINLLDYVDDRIKGDKFISRFVLVDADYKEMELDIFNYNFIEIPKFRKMKDYDLSIPIHRWLLYLDKGTDPKLREEIVMMDARIAHAEEAVKRLVATPEERELYRLRQKYERDKRSSEAYIRQQEREAAELRHQEQHLKAAHEKIKMIEVMLNSGVEVEVIVQTSGLTKLQVLQIQARLNKS